MPHWFLFKYYVFCTKQKLIEEEETILIDCYIVEISNVQNYSDIKDIYFDLFYLLVVESAQSNDYLQIFTCFYMGLVEYTVTALNPP